MSIIDHLIRCATQEEADALMQSYGTSRAYQPRVILQDAEWDDSDPEAPVLVSPEVAAAGFHVWIALDALDESLRDLPDNACRVLADWDLYLSGASVPEWLIYTASDVGPSIISVARIDPEPAGRNYPWRQVSL